jgi:hypothetical protein
VVVVACLTERETCLLPALEAVAILTPQAKAGGLRQGVAFRLAGMVGLQGSALAGLQAGQQEMQRQQANLAEVEVALVRLR